MKSYDDLEIFGSHICFFDLDRDGHDDLIVRSEEGALTVFWGTESGLDPRLCEAVPFIARSNGDDMASELGTTSGRSEEYVADATPIPKVVVLQDTPQVFCPSTNSVSLVPVMGRSDFGAPMVLQIPEAFSVACGDINGDGLKDLVIASRTEGQSGECSWIYWGSEEGFSDNRRTSLPTHRACDVAVADLDGDGFDDVVICQNRTADSFTTESLIFRGGIDGVNIEPKPLPSYDARRVFIDKTVSDRNSHVILTSNFARSASDDEMNTIYFGSEHGYGSEDSLDIPGWGSYMALIADLNDDGHPDIVFANGSEFAPHSGVGSYIYYGSASGYSHEPDLVVPSDRATCIVCGDMNRDGYLDLAITGHHQNSDLLIYYGGEQGITSEEVVTLHLEKDGVVIRYAGLFLADLDNDGWLDIVIAGVWSPHSYVLWGGPRGYSMENSQTLAVWSGRTVQAADLTGNGYLDLIIGAHKPQHSGPHDSFLSIYWNGPEGLKEERKTMLPVKHSFGLSVADFDNDGRLDIFTGAYNDGRERDMESYIYWNREGRGFSVWDRTCLQTHAVGGCLAADFNSDGWVDLAVANHKVLGDHQGYSEVWWNGPKGFSSERTTRLPTRGARGPCIVNPGNIADRGSEEFYESEAHSVDGKRDILGIEWVEQPSQDTWVKAQLRVTGSEEDLSQADWLGPHGPDTWFDSRQKNFPQPIKGRWIQYRLALGAKNSCRTPRVSEVRVKYPAKVAAKALVS